MKNIIYLTNYIGDEIIEKRNNKEVLSQAANNKVMGIAKALESVNYKVIILSSGLVNNGTGIHYGEEKTIVDETSIIYTQIVDLPLINTVSSTLSLYKKIKSISKNITVDGIIFYNFKPEVAIAALMAKKKLHIPIYVEYEDGYSDLNKSFKSFILKGTEKLVKSHVDKAIVVNEIARREFDIPCVTVRGVIDKKFVNKCSTYKKKKNEKVVILYSGGINKKRGINVLIDSLQYINFDCEVWITGGNNLDIADERIKILGFLNYSKVQELMLQADILVQSQLKSSSFSNQSFPSKLFEYLPTGNMIVSSDLQDVKAFAGDAIIYYENDDPKLLAKALEKAVLADSEKYRIKLAKLTKENMPESVGSRLLSLFGGDE